MVSPDRIVILGPRMRITCTILNVLPVPGIGAIVAGWRNPHTRLLRVGIAQAVLVLFGTWPLIFPGIAGFAWAAWTAYTIQRDARPPPPYSKAVPVAGAP